MTKLKNFRAKVSVIMITYNHEQYIKQAIEGVLMQKCNFDVELIIADDCSPDRTEEVVKETIKNHPNKHWVKYTKHSKNKGMNANFIWATEQAKGKYIALCEGDDYWTDPLKLQKQVDFLEENPKMILNFHAYLKLKNNNFLKSFKISKRKQCFVSKKIILKNGGAHRFSVASIVFRKNLLIPIPDFFLKSPVGDLPLILLAISKGDIGYINQEMSVYRVETNTSWSKQNKKNNTFQNLIILHKLIKSLEMFNHETNYIYSKYIKQIISYKVFMFLITNCYEYQSNEIKKLTSKLNFTHRLKFYKLLLINRLTK